MHLYLPAFAIFTFFAPPSDSARLQKFKAEVERTTHKTVVIDEQTSDPHFAGITECDDPKIIHIRIGHNLTGEEKTGVIAHELGHAITCGKFGVTAWRRPFVVPPQIDPELLREARDSVGGCAVEKAADREALKRGFNLKPRDEATKAHFAKWTHSQLQALYRRNGPIYANVAALQQFCFEYRDPSYRNSVLETRILTAVPGGQEKIVSLRQGVSIHDCKTAKECFAATKQVRHAAGLDKYFLLVNPVSGKGE